MLSAGKLSHQGAFQNRIFSVQASAAGGKVGKSKFNFNFSKLSSPVSLNQISLNQISFYFSSCHISAPVSFYHYHYFLAFHETKTKYFLSLVAASPAPSRKTALLSPGLDLHTPHFSGFFHKYFSKCVFSIFQLF